MKRFFLTWLMSILGLLSCSLEASAYRNDSEPFTLYVLEEEEKPLSFQEVTRLDRESYFRESDRINFGRRSGGMWFKVVMSPIPKDDQQALLIPYPGLETLTIYQIDAEGQERVQSSGLRTLMENAVSPSFWMPQYVIPLYSNVVWIRADSSFGIRLPLKIASQDSIHRDFATHSTIYALLIGFLIAVFVNHLAQFVGNGRLVDLYHSLRVAFWYILLPLATSGALVPLAPNRTIHDLQATVIVAVNGGAIFLALFALAYMQMSRMIRRIMFGIVATTVGLTILFYALPKETAYGLMILPINFGAVLIGASVISGLIHSLIRRPDKELLAFVIGMITLLIGSTTYLLHINGFIDLGLLGEFGLLLGAVCEATILSVALGHRTKRMEQEKILIIQEEETNKKFRTFVQILCHDLVNGLSRIMMACDLRRRVLAKEPDLLAKELTFLTRVESAAQHINEIITNVREMEAVALGKKELELESTDLRYIAMESIRRVGHRLSVKKIGVKLYYDEDSVNVLVNPGLMIDSVIVNLLSNAAKFSPKESDLEITIAAWNGYGIIKVLDHGIGMPESIANCVFEAEAKTTRTGTSGEKGTGFGLPLARTLVLKFGGNIAVKSQESGPNTGTAFAVAIPLNKTQGSSTSQPNGRKTQWKGIPRLLIRHFADKAFLGTRHFQAKNDPATEYLNLAICPIKPTEYLAVHQLVDHKGERPEDSTSKFEAVG